MPAQRSYDEFLLPRPGCVDEDPADYAVLTGEDGLTLYETPDGKLLRTIVRNNNVAYLRQYLTSVHDPINALGPTQQPEDDPFYTAARYGCNDTLVALLQQWHTAGGNSQTAIPGPNDRGFHLLGIAGMSAQVETVKLLLGDPWRADFGDVLARDRSGYSPILFAAECCGAAGTRMTEDNEASEYQQIMASRAEETIWLLLAHGASAQDSVLRGAEVQATVLSLAVASASPVLVRHLLEQGAHADAKLTLEFDHRSSIIPPQPRADQVRHVIPLHIASSYANAGAVQILLDAIPGMSAHQTDSVGRNCLHHLALGPYMSDGYSISGPCEGLSQCIAGTIKNLLAGVDNSCALVNTQDQQGDTPLHYAARKIRAKNSSEDVALETAQLFCELGADARIRGRNHETPLHGIGWLMREGEPIDTSLLDVLIAHGAAINDVDDRGWTVLHWTTGNLAYIDIARHLLRKGGDVRAEDFRGRTALHLAANGVMRGGPGVQAGLLTAEDQCKAQAEMMATLVESISAEEANSLLDRPDNEGKTPRQLCREKQDVWRDEDAARRNRMVGRGERRGRGRGRGRGVAFPA